MSKKRGERGRSKLTLDLIETSIEIIEARKPITIRGIAYALFSMKLIESMEKKNTQRVSRILTDAREDGLVEWEGIVDTKRRMEVAPHWSDLKAYARAVEHSYRRDFWSDQDYRVIVVSEKDTVSGILGPILDEYGVPFFPVSGFNSATKVHDLATEIKNDPRHYALLYLGDWDCSGLYMSQIDMPQRLTRYGAGADLFTFERIALTALDTASLPSFDARTKNKDPRYRWYVEQYGYEAWELDAMNPNVLRERVESEILIYIDSAAWKRHKIVEEAQRETTKMIAERLA